MWKTIEFIVAAALILISITEFFYPLLTGKPLFGSFRKQKTDLNSEKKTESIDDKLHQAKAKVDDIKNVQNEVNQHYKSAEQLKEESDNLFNNQKK